MLYPTRPKIGNDNQTMNLVFRTRQLLTIFLAVAYVQCQDGTPSPSKKSRATMSAGKNNISIEILEDLFAKLKSEPSIDLKKPLLWGYFFTDADRKLLESAKKALLSKGYHFNNIHKSDDDSKIWWLHVEKVEVHTVESLNKRNSELHDFAVKMGLASYDGMDVGPVGGGP